MKKSKKSGWWIAALLLTMLIGGCGRAETDTTEAMLETTVMTTEETTEETTPAPTEPLTRDVAEVKIGMIFYGEEEEDTLLTGSLRREMVEAAAAVGMSENQILYQYNSRESEWTQIEDSILACVDQGCQLIIGCAREYEAVIAAIAEEYPEVMFACVGSEMYNGSNSGTYDMDLSVAQYLCGAVAGLQTDTGRVGFLAAKGSEDDVVTDAVNAFAYGVWSTNTEAIVDVAVIGKWSLPAAEDYARDYLQSLGCDVIGGYTDGAIGALTYQWQQYFAMKIDQIIQKQVIGEAWKGTYYEGAVTCDLQVDLPEYVWEQMAQWGPVDVESEETLLETEQSETEQENQTETSVETETEATGEAQAESGEDGSGEIAGDAADETEAPYVIPEIKRDRDTGYLPNVRIHQIDWSEE